VTRRTAIVTGSTSGIGHEIARRLHADGLNVVITGRDERRGHQVCAELGDRATFVALDLTNEGAPATLAATAVTTYGQLDVVVNNAAQDYVIDLLDAPIDEIRHIFNVNAIAPIAVLQETAKVMHHGGAIINISSRLASIGIPTMSIYGATKGAINALTTAAAVELADRNIRVNAVAPGMTRTPPARHLGQCADQPGAGREGRGGRHSLGAAGRARRCGGRRQFSRFRAGGLYHRRLHPD